MNRREFVLYASGVFTGAMVLNAYIQALHRNWWLVVVSVVIALFGVVLIWRDWPRS
jgi:hypothetical protein